MAERTHPGLPTAAERNAALAEQLAEDAESLRTEEETDAQLATDLLRAIAEQVKARGHHAEVESGGGGVTLVVAGRQAPDAAGDLRWSAVVDTELCAISPEYDLDAPLVGIPEDSTMDEIVALIVAVVERDTRPMLFPEPGSKVRFPRKMAATPNPDEWVQEIDVPAGTVGVYERPAGFPYTPANGWIWATAELNGRTVWVPACPDMYERV